MGTSKNRDKIKPSIPLIPDWIEKEEEPIPDENERIEDEEIKDEAKGEEQEMEQEQPLDQEDQIENDVVEDGNRFYQSQRGFRDALENGTGGGVLTRVLKNYVSRTGGGAERLSQRMGRSSAAIASFAEILQKINNEGLNVELKRLDLDQYQDQSFIDILTALTDIICGTGALLDDAITKQAYSNTIVRIEEQNPNLDFDELNTDVISELLAIFLEETIVYRVIADIGRSLTVNTTDIEKSLQMEEDIYQLVNGLVHGIIVPELTTSLNNRENLNKEIEKIYLLAFTTILS